MNEHTQRSGGLRLAIAALLVVFGLVLVAPSFDFDTDGDGVADSVEIYERGTDPAEADAKFNGGFARKGNNG